LAESLEVGLGKVIHPLRVAVTGRMSSAGIFDVLMLLERDRALSRVRAGIESVTALKKKVS
jgi:glutamyl-tRNA synthetase